jgi:hypothetical protein
MYVVVAALNTRYMTLNSLRLRRIDILMYTLQTPVEAARVCIRPGMRIEQIVLCVLCSMFIY